MEERLDAPGGMVLDCQNKANLMTLRTLKTEADCKEALAEFDEVFDAEANSPEADRLDILALLVEAYEEQHYPIPAPDPVAALEYHMDSRGLTRRDLEPYLGSRARAAEVLNRKRGLPIKMIRRLHQGLGISADILIQPYSLSN
jgi:HTH-type transcriptional regulator/antitoxin HigA